MSTIVATLPKVDLCASLLGSPTVDQFTALMREAGDDRDVAPLLAKEGPAGWDAALDLVASVLHKPRQVEAIAYSLAQRMIRDSVVHVEVHVDALRPALGGDVVFDAIERGFERAIDESEDALLSWVIIAEVRRGDDPNAAAAAIAELREAAGERMCGVALSGDEALPIGGLAEVLRGLRAEGMALAVTAGYGGSRRKVEEILALDPSRVVHGHHLPRDEAALLQLRSRRVPVICLPTVETRCGLQRDGAPPSAGRLMEAGLFVTIGSGASGLLGTSMTAELDQVSRVLGWRLEQLRTATARAVEAAFVDPRLRFVIARAVENWRHRPRLTAGGNDDTGYGL